VSLHLGVHRIAADPTWRTPGRVFADLDAEFDFTLDPAASAPIKPGIEWFSDHEQGLWRAWSGRVFVNPPYGRAIQDWMRKISLERDRCEVIVALVPARTDTEWWHEHAMPADEVRFIRGRLSFEGVDAPKGHNAPFPSVILVYRSDLAVNTARQAPKTDPADQLESPDRA
jgi:phage N-6-adenine-methyltransferase